MLKVIEGLPPDILGIDASGKVTHDDYRTVLIPGAEAKMAAGPVKMLFVAGPEFTGYELEALWDDAAFGMKHWHQFTRIAVVTNTAWLRATVTMFSPLFPGRVRLFRSSDLATAKVWIEQKEKAGA